MAVLSADLMPQREGETLSVRKGSLFEVPNRRFSMRYLVETSDALDGPNIIRSSPLVPQLGDSYSAGNDVDIYATCVDVQIRATGSPFAWEVTAVYDTERYVGTLLNNPLNMPAEISWDFAKYERPMLRDLTNTPILNSSKLPFDPPVMQEDVRPLLTIVRNEATYDPSLSVAYQEACNSDVFAGEPAYTAKLVTYSAQKQIDIGFQYWRVTYQIEFRRETFALFLLDQGFRDKDGKIFRDPIDWTPLGSPTLLNGRGESLVKGTTTVASAVDNQQTAISVTDGVTHFPPLTPAPPNWYFEIKIDSEIMQVRDVEPPTGVGPHTWSVVRGWNNTTPAAHLIDATVTLQPYFLRFLPKKSLPFSALNLPVI